MKRTKNADPLRGRDAISQLYRAVQRYVNENNGSLLVVGGIEIQEWPGDLPHNFRVAVHCTGVKPALGVRP